jgi:multiple sugar transport system substrate-binding protein
MTMRLLQRTSARSRAARRSRLMVWVAVAAVAAVVAGCGSSSSKGSSGASQGKSANVVHLTWWTMWSGSTLKILDQMVAKFNQTHPGIQVTTTNIPSDASSSTAKVLSSIAAGDPPDVFTEWWPEIGSFAAKGDLDSMEPYLKGTYAGFKKWEYPVAVQGGSYNKKLYAAPFSLNSWALYYNKPLLAKYGITSPPTTLAQLDADQAKLWQTSGGRVSQLGFYPDTNENGFQFYTTFFGATNCIKNGKYDFASCPAAQKEMNWIASYDKYSYTQVESLQTALGQVAGGQTDIWTAGKSGFVLSGPWEGAQDVPTGNPSLKGNFGVVPFPGTVGTSSTIGQGNFNIIPKGSKHPKQAFEFIAWLAGYHNEKYIASIDPSGGWIPAGPSVTRAPAYKAWEAKDPWMKTFVAQMTSKATQAPLNTPKQSQLFTAENTATADVLQKQMTAQQALAYIDKQAN